MYSAALKKVSGISFERMTTDMGYAALRRPAVVEDCTSCNQPSATLVLTALWMMRICCWCCGIFLFTIGVVQMQHSMPGIPLILGALIMILSEPVFYWLNKIQRTARIKEKKWRNFCYFLYWHSASSVQGQGRSFHWEVMLKNSILLNGFIKNR